MKEMPKSVDLSNLAMECVTIISSLHSMMSVIIEGEEHAKKAKEQLPQAITAAIDKVSELCSVATVVSKGQFEVAIKTDDDDEEAEDTGEHKPFKLED